MRIILATLRNRQERNKVFKFQTLDEMGQEELTLMVQHGVDATDYVRSFLNFSVAAEWDRELILRHMAALAESELNNNNNGEK